MFKFGFLVIFISVVTQKIGCQRSQINNERIGNLDWTPPDYDPAQFAQDRVSQDEYCECVLFYLCDRNTGRIIDTGSGLVRWRTGGTDTPKKCKEIGEVCCKPPLWAEKIEGTPPEDPSYPPVEASSENINNWNLPEEDPSKETTDYNNPSVNEHYPEGNPDQDIDGHGHPQPNPVSAVNEAGPLRCGERRPQKVDYRNTALRVSGSDLETQTNFAEYPWMIMIHTIERGVADLKLFLCGGSLIHPRIVMTAAHCVAERKIEDLETRAGEWDTTTQSEPLKHQNRLVESVIIHPSYNESHPRHDIALILLKEPFILADNVNTICLPEDHETYIGSKCVGTGWGMDNSGKRPEESQNVLRKAELPIVSKKDCQKMLRTTRLGRYFLLHDSFICAGGDELDLCVGDGGGPLTCYNEKTENDVQIGITSWGIGCGRKGVPGVYTDVLAHRDWIWSTVDYLLNGYRV